ncbi:hypothetical protein CLF_103367 [Clonorchis sinensis]|uniref:C2H2-type domain-containing protein n=1 Tax=Clonorchis sinensis TaxID=79923 RepID=H2KQ70_CLOSI|nr:hypothetical protein CLF_103367 [Clonorchis sinensis]
MIETENEQRTICSLDCEFSVNANYGFSVGIHRKSTHSDRYLHYESSYVKRAVVGSLTNRIKKLCSDESIRAEELTRLSSILQQNKYPMKLIAQQMGRTLLGSVRQEDKNPILTVGIPYRVDTSDAIRKILRDYSIKTFFRIDDTLQRHLIRAKDPIELKHRTNCVYQIPCAECPAKYIGQTARQLHVRIAEHKQPVPLETIANASTGFAILATLQGLKREAFVNDAVSFDYSSSNLQQQIRIISCLTSSQH